MDEEFVFLIGKVVVMKFGVDVIFVVFLKMVGYCFEVVE